MSGTPNGVNPKTVPSGKDTLSIAIMAMVPIKANEKEKAGLKEVAHPPLLDTIAEPGYVQEIPLHDNVKEEQNIGNEDDKEIGDE